MHSLAKKFLFSRELDIGDAAITLLGQRRILIPADFIILIEENLQQEKNVYKKLNDICVEMGHKYIETLKKRGVKQEDLLRLFLEIENMSGWGRFEMFDLNIGNRSAIIRCHNSISKPPIQSSCTILNSILSGALSEIFNSEIASKETQCISKGAAYCEFVLQPRDKK